jgi:CPA1 family monovalent cation:H+ antiporter
LNDAAGLIIFRFALLAVNTGSFVMHEAAASFFIVITMGILTGILIALVFYAIYRWLPTTPDMDILLSFIAPYMMYIVAESLHVSGVLSVVSGGLFLSARSHLILGYRSRFQGQHVWSTIAFALNGFIFLLIGLELPVLIKELGSDGLYFAIKCGLVISFSLIVLRLLCTFGASLFTRFISRFITTADSNPGWRGPLIFGWAGMRGVVSLAAALSIPLHLTDGTPFPYRDLILFITFSVIITTLVLQGLTLPWVVKWMALPDPDYPFSTIEQEIILRKKMSVRALEVMEKQYGERVKNNPWLLSLESRFRNDVENSPFVAKNCTSASYADYRQISLELLQVQRRLLRQLNKKRELDERIIRKYQALLDLEEEKVRQQFGEEEL